MEIYQNVCHKFFSCSLRKQQTYYWYIYHSTFLVTYLFTMKNDIITFLWDENNRFKNVNISHVLQNKRCIYEWYLQI